MLSTAHVEGIGCRVLCTETRNAEATKVLADMGDVRHPIGSAGWNSERRGETAEQRADRNLQELFAERDELLQTCGMTDTEQLRWSAE